MKVNWNYIKAFGLLALVILLYSFSTRRNSARKVEEVSVKFTNGENLYVTESTVNKLLIVNIDTLANRGKEVIDLNNLEQILDTQDMIQDADVYLTVDKKLIAKITQRKPLARVYGSRSFYIDVEGKKMPLSKIYTARVPLVTGINEKGLSEIYPLLQKIENDKFLKEHITTISTDQEGNYKLALRVLDFNLVLGNVDALDKKINNFKAFYKKAMKDKKLDAYRSVSLAFNNQVVCTKK
jgi:cell division protein FtsQ